jgi:hypothetical protein
LLGSFKRLAVIEFQLRLAVGKDPPAQRISAAKKILEASEYDGMKVVKCRVVRFIPHIHSFGMPQYVGVENLDTVVA